MFRTHCMQSCTPSNEFGPASVMVTLLKIFFPSQGAVPGGTTGAGRSIWYTPISESPM